MQILLTLRPEQKLIIPFNYNYQLQSAIYSLLETVNASEYWHNVGFGYLRTFKGFCFGKLDGKFTVDFESKKICFCEEIHLEIRSPSFEFIDSFQRAIEHHPFLTIFDTRLNVISASLTNLHFPDGNISFSAVTPVIIHTTLPDKHTYFFTPLENEFFQRLCNNASRKYEAITGCSDNAIEISPVGNFKKVVTKYKGYILVGYTGIFSLKTSLPFAEFIYNTGIGEKNSQGFGFLQVK